MKLNKRFILIISATTVLLSGCLETPEQAEARRTQFNGKTIAQVANEIGKPTVQDDKKAVWIYQHSYTNRVPIQSYINGAWITTGYRSEQVRLNCTYTAKLNAGLIKTSTYDGNSCARYSPKLKK
jgi:protein involved in sex pheromone biosynthesis